MVAISICVWMIFASFTGKAKTLHWAIEANSGLAERNDN